MHKLPVEEFALRFGARASRLAWLAGAGTAAAAGIPTGYDMIADFKARLFAAAAKLPRNQIDVGDPLWRERITSYFDGAHGLPPAGDPAEYAVLFERVYPDPADRRAYIDAAVRRGTPSFGHRVLASLIAARLAPCVFTTNFDPLIERAAVVADELLPAGDRAHLTVAALDSNERAERCVRESDWPLLVKLHGDYQSEQLKNTTAELASQDERHRRVLVEGCQRFGLVVVGYSGRDASVMAALHAALDADRPYPGGLFWVTRPGGSLLQAARDFLDAAARRAEVAVVEAENFDEFAAELARQVDLPAVVAEHVHAARPAARLQPVALPTVEAGQFPALRCSALPVLAMPAAARAVRLAGPSTTPAVRELVREVRPRPVVACVGDRVAAFGRDADLLTALAPLGARFDGEMPLDPRADSWALGLLYDALTRALARGRPLRPMLRTAGHALVLARPDPSRTDEAAERDRERLRPLVSAYGGSIDGTVPNVGVPFAEAIRMRLEWRLDRWWCVFDPYTWVDVRGDDRPGAGGAVDAAADFRRERWAARYNRAWSQILGAWAGLLAPFEPATTVRAVGVRDDPGVEATFSMGTVTAWSRPARAGVWSQP